ncbi:MAG: hypothetical protein JWQ09_3742 [Segetibacter sp.]|nr:hypothetical protein [Segetibacter sp.]
MIKSLVNKEGVKERENEVIFSFSEKFVQTYIGRQQSAEDKVIPIKGRPLNDEEIVQTEKENPFTRHHFLCPECEDKLSVLESMVSQKILTVIRRYVVKNAESYDTVVIADGDLLRLFIYSLAWRAAVTRMNDFEMLPSHQEILRDALNKSLSLDPKEFVKKVEENVCLIRNVKIVVSFLETASRNDNYIYCSLAYKPYAMILNDLSFQLFFDDAPDNGFDRELMGINRVINRDELLMQGEVQFHAAVLSDKSRKQINANLNNLMVEITLKPAIELFSLGVQKFVRRKPTADEIALFIKNVERRNHDKLENYTPADFTEAATQTMQQLFPQLF